jgi:cadmium resistance transport/sequestration family protein
MTVVLQAVGAFVATNIDDIFILMLFFSQVSPTFHKRHIVTGQYLGFAALVTVSLLGLLGAVLIPQTWIGLLGLIPLGIGLIKLVNLFRGNDKETEPVAAQPESAFSSILGAQTYSVAAVTFANGADNISIYVPLFASAGVRNKAIIIVVFLVMVGVWCYAGFRMVHYPAVAQFLKRYGHIVTPFVFIGLGIYILLESGTLAQN